MRNKRNWRRHWWDYTIHYLQGVAMGVLIPWPFNVAMCWYDYKDYQDTEYQRFSDRRDSEFKGMPVLNEWPSRDKSDKLMGQWTGVAIQLAAVGYVAYKGWQWVESLLPLSGVWQ